jgi:hypothetical protein
MLCSCFFCVQNRIRGFYMAMLITRFHKLIQSKVVWYIFLGVIVIAFVGFFTPTMNSGAGRKPDEQFEGELFGEKISRSAYRHAYQNTYIWQILSSGRMLPMDAQLDRRIREEAWVRLAALKKAEQEKMLVTDAEVIDQIRRMPVFLSQDGTFDSAQYRGILQTLGVTSGQIEDLFREQIVFYKLMYRPMQAALISPFELEEAYHIYTDRLVLNYAVLKRDDVAQTVEVTREEAEALYNENPAAFRMPEKVRVSYVEFPVEDFLDEAAVTEDEVLQAYNRNLEDYRIESTGDVSEVEYRDFEEVQVEITAALRKEAARQLAARRASDFVAEIAPRAEDEQPEFTETAQADGLSVRTLPAFGPNEPLPGIDASAPFGQAAFGLQADNFSSFSDPVVGRESVYVLKLEQRYPAFIPPFDAVEADVMKAARNRKISETLAGQALELVSAAEAAVDSGKSFEEAASLFGLEVETTEEFDASTQLDHPYADVLVRAGLNVAEGGISPPMPVEEGVLIAHVLERKSTDSTVGMPAVRQELIADLSRAREQRLAASWQNALLEEAEFKLLRTQSSE